MTAVDAGRLLDLLAEAVARCKREGVRGIDWVLFHSMTKGERLAFDLWLVKSGDPLAEQPGTIEARFRARVLAMALNRPAVNAMGFMDLSEPAVRE